ncbi:MAG: hypothetical protein IT462_12900 [Planctomycetes bacterium]|nr:hypothetical protein [Planctomycetota bacterium]
MRFDARVIGLPDHLTQAQKGLSKKDYAQEQAKFEAARAKLMAKLAPQSKDVVSFFDRAGAIAAHFRCDRFQLLKPLQDYACFLDGTTPEEVARENAWTASLHTVLIGQNDAIAVPFDFTVPYDVEVPGRIHKYVIVSSLKMKKELEALNEYVAVEKTLGIEHFPDFVDASKTQMEAFERKEGVGRRFWAKFGLIALRGLVEKSVELKLPLLIDPQWTAVPSEV